MVQNDIQIFQNTEELAARAANYFVDLTTSKLRKKDSFRVALSGGSTPLSMYSILVQEAVRDRVNWEKVFFFWGDERYVPHDHPESNYGSAHQALFEHLPVPDNHILPINTENSPEQDALAYQETIKQHFEVVDPQISLPRFDLIYLGMGTDGHTASLFPHSPALEHLDQWVVANHVEALDTWRITMTPTIINAAEYVIFLVRGIDKAERLNEVVNGPYKPAELPAQLIRPEYGQLIWLIDQAASSVLEKR
jgi:6-phosphogluconolactonase